MHSFSQSNVLDVSIVLEYVLTKLDFLAYDVKWLLSGGLHKGLGPHENFYTFQVAER